MSEYYQVSATLPEPTTTRKPTHPQVGRRSLKRNKDPEPPAPDDADSKKPIENPEWQQPPAATHPEPSAPAWQPYETKSAPPPYTENEEDTKPDLKPAEINPKLRGKCESCEKILRRLFPIALLFAYTLLGGIIFHLTESKGQSESEILKGHRVLIDKPAALQLQERMTEIVLDRNYTRERRKYEVREALLWYLRQLSEEEKARWDFASALFYSMTLYTTIGYGDTPPKTTAGRVLTVIYSIVGIPLCLAALIELGDLVALAISKLWSGVRRGWTTARRRSRRAAKSGDWEALPSAETATIEKGGDDVQDESDLLSFPLSALFLLTFFWLLFTALLFWAWENWHGWTYAQSLYFTFISFTTIGLGDFVPETTWGKLGGILFLLVGLALVSTTIAVLQQQFDALQHQVEREIDIQYQDSQSDTGVAMATDDKDVDAGFKTMVSKMPLGARLLFRVLPESKKKNLKKYYQQKAAMHPKSMQTDDYLWAMTSMSKSFLKQIVDERHGREGEEGGYSDDTKSRDDVNSLVALCDYSLPYGYEERDRRDYNF